MPSSHQPFRGQLALLGGSGIRTFQWPGWPRASATTQRNVLDVLHSTRWTLSGPSDRQWSYEQRFAEAFAAYCGSAHCVPCANGTAALTIALQALGIGPGDEVIVPGLTWVACASAVCHVGAVPVLADVVPETLCLSPEACRAAFTPHTRAIMVVHLYSAMADMEALRTLARERGVALIEDASQAHGAVRNGRRAGKGGIIGTFSMQQTKLLTAGEGGAVVTDDADLYEAMQQLRADGRVYGGTRRTDPFRDLVHHGRVLGRNLCLSEFHAAILADALTRLDAENDLRHRNALLLAEMLRDLPGVELLTGDGRTERPTHYKLCLRLSEEALRGAAIGTVCRALAAELRLAVEPVDRPLNDNPLYQPLLSPMLRRSGADPSVYDPRRFSLPVATGAARRCLTLPHWSLLGDHRDLEDIVAALSKVLDGCNALRGMDSAGSSLP